MGWVVYSIMVWDGIVVESIVVWDSIMVESLVCVMHWSYNMPSIMVSIGDVVGKDSITVLIGLEELLHQQAVVAKVILAARGRWVMGNGIGWWW